MSRKFLVDGYDIDLAMNLLRLKNGVSFDELRKRKIYLSETFRKKLEDGIENNLLEKSGLRLLILVINS